MLTNKWFIFSAFAVAMCNKLWDMVDCESTAAERRAKLVRALRTVHGGGKFTLTITLQDFLIVQFKSVMW